MVTDNFLENLKLTGVKITTPRKEILKVLSSNPFSAQEVRDLLREKGISIDLVTVYRTLELFTNLELVRRATFEDKIARYELHPGEDHHHHLVCIKCGVVEDVVINENKFVKEIEKQSEFKVERHALEFFGFCKRCQE
jgi:Fur family ferric uptake transcriptional regulator